jgi:hypothetical protein
MHERFDHVPGGSRGSQPAPTPPLDWAAGERCDFAVHLEPVVDEVVQKVLSTYADGSTEWIAFKGDLIVRVTNTENGAFHDAASTPLDVTATAHKTVDFLHNGSADELCERID